MSSYLKTTLNKINWSLELYDAEQSYHQQFLKFSLPSWSIDNFNRNKEEKADFKLSENETYEDLTEQQKEKLRKRIFDSWSEGIWNIIRLRLGLKLDIFGYNRLDPQIQNLLKLSISHQVNYWRINLPWEISNNVTRISGSITTTINASEFLTGFDGLSSLTKTTILSTGITRLDISKLLVKRYREDTLLLDLENTKERLTLLEDKDFNEINTNDFVKRTELFNTFALKNRGYITKNEGDDTYVLKQDFENSLSGGYFDTQTFRSDNRITKTFSNTDNTKNIVETRNSDSLILEVKENGNTEKSFVFNKDGLKIDGSSLPSANAILSTISTTYETKAEAELKKQDLENLNTAQKTYIDTEIEKLTNDKTTTSEIENLHYTKTYIDTNFYNKSEVDTKITTAQTSGQVDLSNYYNINETDNLLTNYYTKANSDLRLSGLSASIVSKTSNQVQEMTANLTSPKFIIRTEPVINSNNASRMEDIVSEVKRLFVEAITEYDKTSKKEYSDIGFISQFHNLEGDDEELIITVGNQQIIIDAANLSSTNFLVRKNTYYRGDGFGNDIQTDQLIYLKTVDSKLQFSSQSTSREIGPAGIGRSGDEITNISKVIIRKDSVRELVNSLQKIN